MATLITEDEAPSLDELSLLGDNCVTQENMKFENQGEKGPKAFLYILNLDLDDETDGSYAMASIYEVPGFDEREQVSALGTCTVGSGEGKTTNISLTLNENYAGKVKLRFSNADVETINGSTKDDVIYINSNGVSETATLDFSQGGTDTIYFNGATTVQKISGGGSDGSILTLKPEGNKALDVNVTGSVNGKVNVEGASSNDSLKIVTVEGTVNATLGDGDDSVEIDGIAANAGAELTGGKGNDSYYLKTVSGDMTIIDFGFAADSAGGAADSALGADIIYVDALDDETLGKITYLNFPHKKIL